ncbi:uncharacterized protein AB9W97_008518 isoform 2-T7 [Spinachia spinachia]
MSAETEAGAPDGSRFWEEMPPVQRAECHDLRGLRARLRNLAADDHQARVDLRRLRATLRLVREGHRRLEERLEQVVWSQNVSLILHAALAVFCCLSFCLHLSAGYSGWRTFIR